MNSVISENLLGGMHHVAFTVSDLDRSIDFYSKLGFKLFNRWKEGPEVCAEGIGVPDAEIELAQLSGYSILLEFIAFASPAAKKSKPNPTELGSAHLAFTVADADLVWSEVRAAGGVTVSDVRRDAFADWFQIRDPDGIPIEFLQIHG